jgi:hypothetical protein
VGFVVGPQFPYNSDALYCDLYAPRVYFRDSAHDQPQFTTDMSGEGDTIAAA